MAWRAWKALQYALGRWEALTRYAGNDRLAIDNTWPSGCTAASQSPPTYNRSCPAHADPLCATPPTRHEIDRPRVKRPFSNHQHTP
jgi:hypothetical protein